jgi:hypothetical protein
MTYRIGLASLAALLLACGVEAQQTPGKKGPNPAAQAAAAKNQATHAALIGELQQAATLLEQAIHDYDGHRAAALHGVHQAMHALKHDMHHHNKTGATVKQPKPANPTTGGTAAAPQQQTANKPKNTNANKETQAASDAQLKQAMTGLQSVLNQLGSLPQGPKHVHAEEHVKKAIHHLHTALEIK